MRALRATMISALLEAWANRRGFWTQVSVMVVNDIVWVIFWFVFFDEVGSVRGWDRDQLMVLLAGFTISAGIVLGLFANVRHLGDLAADGGLDAALVLPVPTLAHVLARRVNTANLGDVVFGIVLFAAFGNPTPTRALTLLFGVVAAVGVITGFLVLAGSVSFWVGRNDAGQLGFHSILMFSAYPVDIFTGYSKFLLFTVIPAGFVTGLPAGLVTEWDLRRAVVLVAVSTAFASLGWAAFRLGLRRYASGSIWTRA